MGRCFKNADLKVLGIGMDWSNECCNLKTKFSCALGCSVHAVRSFAIWIYVLKLPILSWLAVLVLSTVIARLPTYQNKGGAGFSIGA